MKKLVSFITLFVIGCWTISAQTLPSLLVSSDAAGLGKANVTVADGAGAYSLENNAASMSFADFKAAGAVSYGMWQPSYANDKILGAGAACRVTDRFAMGLIFKNFNQPSYEITNSDGQSSGTFTPGELSIGLGAAYSITDWLSVGVTGRMVNSKLADDAKANVFGADISLFYKKDAISAGISVNNIGSKVNYGGEDYTQPMLARAGAAWRIGNPEASSVTPSVEADLLFEGGFMAGLGIEYSYKSMLFVRGGFHYGDKEKAIPTYASLGLGVRLWGISLDVSYLTASDVLGNSVAFGLGYRF